MAVTTRQLNKLGDYLLDISKLAVGIFVFTSIPDRPLQLALGCISAISLLIAGIILTKEDKQ